MSWFTLAAMAMFGLSIILAFETERKTRRMIFWRLTLVVSAVLICFYPCDALCAAIGHFLSVVFTFGYGLLCGTLFYGLLLLVSWVFHLETGDIYDFLLGPVSDK